MGGCFFDSSFVWTLVDTLASFCIAINPHAHDEVWWSTWGGRISVMSVHSNVVNTMIVVDSTNPYGRITNIVFDPTRRNVIYASGLHMQGVYRSADHGRTWEVIRRRAFYMTNYVGECLQVVQHGLGVRIVSANFSRGELESSDDEGRSWTSIHTGLTGSICSVHYDQTQPDRAVLGCKYGKLIQAELQGNKHALTHVLENASYCEVPRIRRSVESSDVLFGISAGFDNAAKMPGLFRSCDGGASWQDSWLPGVSLWALECCGCGRHVVVGGFSEFDEVVGRGIVAVVDVHNDLIKLISSGIPWQHGANSVWDMSIVQDSLGGSQALLIATEDGVYRGDPNKR